MSTHRKLSAGASGLLAAALVFGTIPADAGVITLSDDFSLDSGFTSEVRQSETNTTSVYFDAFDNSLGTLTGVQITVNSQISGSSFVSIVADSTSEGARTTNFSSHFFDVFDDTVRVARDVEGGALCMAGDGSAPGTGCFNILSHGAQDFTDDMSFGPGDLGNFSSGGPWAITLRTNLLASWLVAPDAGSLGAGRSFAGNITVAYDYEPGVVQPVPVPAPAPSVLMLSGLAILAVARIRRSRRAGQRGS